MKTLVVDDEANVRKTLVSFLELRSCAVREAADPESGWDLWLSQRPDLTLIDVYLGDRDGRELLARIRERDGDACVVMVSGHADLRTAVEAVRAGAFDFLEKPIDAGRLDTLLRNAADRLELAGRVGGLEREWLSDRLVQGASPAVRAAFDLAAKAAASNLSVLIQGPSGSGKELLARFLRLRSKRAAAAFVVANCAAIPAELFEGELFGSLKGAYTGAAADRKGYFGAAEGGTLFLDEIGELPLTLQPKLLRAIEYGEIQPLGAGSPLASDVRLICATNRDLEQEAGAGRFREDLYFRLAQVTLRLPSLAERREDIAELAAFFLTRVAADRRFAPDAIDRLRAKAWPGNIRELRNYVEKCAALIENQEISGLEMEAMERGLGTVRPRPTESGGGAISPNNAAGADAKANAGMATDPAPRFLDLFGERGLREAREEFDRAYVRETLERRGSVNAAAESLGLLPNNLSRLLRKLGISRMDGRSG